MPLSRQGKGPRRNSLLFSGRDQTRHDVRSRRDFLGRAHRNLITIFQVTKNLDKATLCFAGFDLNALGSAIAHTDNECSLCVRDNCRRRNEKGGHRATDRPPNLGKHSGR
jgi:hypothetical protein